LKLEVTAWCEGVKSGVHDRVVVFGVAEHGMTVDKVVFLGEIPFIFVSSILKLQFGGTL
jgi:hypothetical protein